LAQRERRNFGEKVKTFLYLYSIPRENNQFLRIMTNGFGDAGTVFTTSKKFILLLRTENLYYHNGTNF